jgi:hypothetical protein
MICIEDIAHSLALTNRYNGMTRYPYSVAEHCVRMALCDDLPGHPLAKLLHDAAEAYIGDIVKPFKAGLRYLEHGFEENERYYYKIETLEHEIQNAILKAFNIKVKMGQRNEDLDWMWLNSSEVKHSDMAILAEECNVLMPDNEISKKEFEKWLAGVTPSKTGLTHWNIYPWLKARTLYYNTFKELTK